MIKVIVRKKNNIINKIVISGHAMYADYGQDIVCASVSTLVISSVNGINLIDNEALIVKQDKDMEIIIKKHTDVIDKLIYNMTSSFEELVKQYPKNINIKEETIC